jgi:3-hydroxyisobutyrate dehydrogenase-like beta-hydroxyacid dehydrogenase
VVGGERSDEPTKWVTAVVLRSEKFQEVSSILALVACRQPLRGFTACGRRWTTGSRTHPWLYAVTRFAGSPKQAERVSFSPRACVSSKSDKSDARRVFENLRWRDEMKVGFIGLGNMGSGMARNLLKAGHSVTVYNRTRSRSQELQQAGASVAESPADASHDEVVITMLSDDRAVEQVVFGSDGLLSVDDSKALHISMSTIGVALSDRLADAHASKGTAYVAAPVFGRPAAAEAAQLAIIAAGPSGAIEQCQPLFEVMGRRTSIVGEKPSSANLLKLIGNFMLAAAIETLGEAFALGRKGGLDPVLLLDVLTGTLFPAPVYKNYGGMIARQEFEPAGFKLPLGLKDVRLVMEAGESLNVPLPVASLIRDHFITALARGWEEKDWSAVSLVSAEAAGL